MAWASWVVIMVVVPRSNVACGSGVLAATSSFHRKAAKRAKDAKKCFARFALVASFAPLRWVLFSIAADAAPISAPHSYIVCSSIFFCAGKRSPEINTAGALQVFWHQCEVPFFSGATSPVLCTMGTAQLLAYSVTSPETM